MGVLDFNKGFVQYTNGLKGFAMSLTNNAEDAKDLFQETAFRAMANRDKFKLGTNQKAWLFTIMKNIFINNYRKKRRANVIIDTTENQYYLNSGAGDVSNGGEASMLMKELKDLIRNLDSSIRIPFEMHYQGFKYKEIAEAMELPIGTIKSRIFFARKALKEQAVSLGIR